MKERPILFSGAMVRAIRNNEKTQTRRVVKMQPHNLADIGSYGAGRPFIRNPAAAGKNLDCPYGYPGDRLWVRETFYAFGRWETRFSQKKGRDEWHFVDMTLECGHSYAHAATSTHPLPMGKRDAGVTPGWWKRPAIHMHHRASRILLEIVSVRVERLQDISIQDTVAEGARSHGCFHAESFDPFDWFVDLWQDINGPQSWATNPWVWAIEFKVIQP